ncbi:MAG: toxin TcdB middle/N-terminal domain-containing protein, partial [Myxococcota bacterium]
PVWLSREGDATYLELFPVRPNQLSRVENGLGMVTEITYGTSIQHMARDGGWEAWEHRLPHPMLVVDQVDRYDLLTNLHEITQYRYHDGFYDGVEKQFRGYARVEAIMLGDETQEDGLIETSYDVGATDPYRNGLMLNQVTASDGRILNSQSTTYEDCDVDQIPAGTALPIRFICATATQQTLQEGTTPDQHAIVESTMEYDGYGNVVRQSNLGVTSIGGQGCAACEADPAPFGAPCGQQCLGDEVYNETSYIPQGESTSGRWILSAPFREVTYGRPGSAVQSETLTYYDGDDFVGMDLGTLDQGKATRVTRSRDNDNSIINITRNAHDRHGNLIESITPLGDLESDAHRRRYTYDEDNLRVVQMDVLNIDPEGNPYQMRRELTYEPTFNNMVESTEMMRVVNGQVVSPRRSTNYNYDQFGRIISTILPGDDASSPTQEYIYDQGSPVSRITSLFRSKAGQPYDLETIECYDGRGRVYQTRTRLSEGLYQINGFTIYNTRGSARRIYQPYTSTSSACDLAPPEGTLFNDITRDATNRVVEKNRPDAAIFGTASI